MWSVAPCWQDKASLSATAPDSHNLHSLIPRYQTLQGKVQPQGGGLRDLSIYWQWVPPVSGVTSVCFSSQVMTMNAQLTPAASKLHITLSLER